MARIGGRNTWIAVPAGLVCAALVAGLVWLALPMLPASGAWVVDLARKAVTPVPAIAPEERPAMLAATGMDCRDLYPNAVWAELVWSPGALLSQSTAPPQTDETALLEALAPAVVLTCAWRIDGGTTVVSTLSTVDAASTPVADAALRGAGFTCASGDRGLSCARTRGDVVEEHVLHGGLWLASRTVAWSGEDYGTRLAAWVWG
jgi:hypothetical protein